LRETEKRGGMGGTRKLEKRFGLAKRRKTIGCGTSFFGKGV